MTEWAKILKANPYHDEKGRFSTGDKAKFVSTGGVFANQKGGSDSTPSKDVQAAIKEYTAKGGTFASKFTATQVQRDKLKDWLSGGVTGEGISLWHGDAFSNAEWDARFEDYTTPGKIIKPRSPSFSEDRVRTGGYKGGAFPIKLEVVGGMRGRDIQKHSVYPEEKEHMAAPDSRFKVVSSEYKNSIWYIKVEDVSLSSKGAKAKKRPNSSATKLDYSLIT